MKNDAYWYVGALVLIVGGFGLFAVFRTDADRSKFSNWITSTDAHIECYSGGKLIFDGRSTGKVISEKSSDGYAFVDKADGVLKEVSGNCIISYEE